MREGTLHLKPGREASLLRRHPWVFGGAVGRVADPPEPGGTIVVRSSKGEFIARAAYNPNSQIVARVWTWEESEVVDEAYFRRRIEGAIAARGTFRFVTNSLRWVNAENDGLPGLIIDRYGKWAVAQFLSAGAAKWKKEIAEALAAQQGIAGVYDRSDADILSKEGLPQETGVLLGEPPPDRIEIHERILRFEADVIHGHKTGFYLDQRENRRIVAGISDAREVLNAFCYTGGFTVGALVGGAGRVTSVDSSAPALEQARRHIEMNVPDREDDAEWIEGDVFGFMRTCRDSGRMFDLVILDPPKFAHARQQVEKATRAYKDINWLAFRLLRPGGLLVTFSCSGLVSEDLFQKVVFGAALDAKREAQIIRRLGQASDHPVRLTFPEGAYLKGFVCRAE